MGRLGTVNHDGCNGLLSDENAILPTFDRGGECNADCYDIWSFDDDCLQHSNRRWWVTHTTDALHLTKTNAQELHSIPSRIVYPPAFLDKFCWQTHRSAPQATLAREERRDIEKVGGNSLPELIELRVTLCHDVLGVVAHCHLFKTAQHEYNTNQ